MIELMIIPLKVAGMLFFPVSLIVLFHMKPSIDLREPSSGSVDFTAYDLKSIHMVSDDEGV